MRMKRTAFLGVAVALSATHAWADGPVTAYYNGAPVQSTLDQGEYVINADGAKEDPDHRMSDVARAYRNGLINGRAQQQQIDAKQHASVPPIPPVAQYGQAPRYAPVVATEPMNDDEPPPPQALGRPALMPPPPPPPPVIVQYVQPPYGYAYAPPPPPPPVYVQPSIAVGVPVYSGGYWNRGGYWRPGYHYAYGRGMRWRRW